MSKNPLDFGKNLFKKTKKHYNKKNVLSTILMLIMVCFFYSQGFGFSYGLRAEAKEYSFENGFTMQNSDKWYFEKLKDSFNDEGASRNEVIPGLKDNKFEKEIADMTHGFPIEEMAPFIAQYDKKIAGLIIGIAKKESNWGKRSPSKNGKTCYNYWGYKGAGSLGTSMGYGCFSSAQEATSAIGGRISELAEQELDTPSKIVVWKCGRSCAATGGQAAANKWISDISVYYDRIVNS